MEMNSLGLIELTSIAAGMQAADIMLKTSNVQLVVSRTICSGKYMVLIGGDVAEVQAAVDRAAQQIEFAVIDTFVIPNVHKDIFPALSGHSNIEMLEALGILESFSVASLIEGADAAVKSANVKIIEIRLAMALGGKAFCTLTGEVAAVTSAVESGAKLISDKGLLVNKVVIPQPRQELLSEMI
ncbi:MAG: BMC domain-containing protein [Stygiobacter sp.]|jgi:microcompartment protein CcmL/EutN|uniref:BMC domain-containing protein n=1 Tax=Stygiobacter electus TaxID=3032292 RepID=A0AAE3NUX6_9BACT|nr:BMC domain-containing protein [Stygiobacter electus]MDF1611381.1 BMC domain-containing protein [Stygiobacter electus]